MRPLSFLLTALFISGALSRPADSSEARRPERLGFVPRQVDAALEPSFGDLPRGELMEDGARIWWMKGEEGRANFHIVGGLVLQEGRTMQITLGKSKLEETMCENYFRPLLEEWLENRRHHRMRENFYYITEFSEENGRQSAQLQNSRPYRGYVGVLIRSKLRDVDGQNLASDILDYFRTVRPSFDHRVEEVPDVYRHGHFIRGPQKSRPVPVDSTNPPPPSPNTPPPPYALRGFHVLASHHQQEDVLRVRVVGGLRVTDPAAVSALSQSGKGVAVAGAFFSHMRRYCMIFGKAPYMDQYSVRWAPVFQGFSDVGPGEDVGAVGAFFEKSYDSLSPDKAHKTRTEDAKLFEDYFRDVGMPAEIEWVDDAFYHDGQKAPPLERDDPTKDPKIKVGGLQVGEGLI